MKHAIHCAMIVAAITSSALAPARAETIPEMLPAETLLYLQWPGIESLSKSASETELASMMNEPEIKHFRRQWNQQTWPVLEDMLVANMNDGAKAWPAIKSWLKGTWTYPTGIALVGVDMGPAGPQVDLAVIVRAGRDAGSLVDAMDQLILLALEDAPPEAITDVPLKGTIFKQVLLPGMPIPLRYAARDGDVIVTLGIRLHQRWMTDADTTPSLQESSDFKRALQVTEGSDLTPLMYLNLEATVQTLERFQPLFAGLEVPVLGEAGGVRRVLEQTRYAGIKSLSMAMRPHARGFKTTTFLHQPADDRAPESVRWVREKDVQAIPQHVTWAGLSKGSMVESYTGMLSMIEGLSPEMHAMIGMFIGRIEAAIEMPVEEVLAGFQDTWILYDAPDHGGLWFTGLTLVAEVKDDNKIDLALRRMVVALSSALEAADSVVVREETYRDATIAYVNVAGLPMPLAPAWAQVKGYWILALHPQMVRAAADHLLDARPSLADNPDFKRARALMPDKVDALSYGDVRRGVETMYRLALPLSQMGISMAQGEGIPIDAGLLPSMPAISRHLFGAVGASAPTEDGYLWITHTPVPGLAPGSNISAKTAMIILPITGITLLGQKVEQTFESVDATLISAANLKSIATACLTYAEGHQGNLPPDLETLLQGEERAYLEADTLKAPQDESDDKISYIYIPGQKNVMNPQNVLLYEKPDLNDGEGVNVATLDGRVKFMTIPEFEAALAATQKRLGVGDKGKSIMDDFEQP